MEGIWLISYIVLWALVVALAVLVLLLYRQLGIMYLGSAEGVSRDGLERGKPAPDFALTDQHGNTHRLSAYRGRPVVLLFGSPHCSPCRILLPQLQDWARKHPEVTVLWLNAASPEESARFVAETGATIPILPFSPDDNLMDRYRVRVTPFTFFLDAQGVIRAKGLVNTKSGLDLYYRELLTGKPVEPEEARELLEQEETGRQQEHEEVVARTGG